MLHRAQSNVWAHGITRHKQIERKVEAAEMWFWRRMLQIPFKAMKTNQVFQRNIADRPLLWTHQEMKRIGTFYHKITNSKQEAVPGRGRQSP